ARGSPCGTRPRTTVAPGGVACAPSPRGPASVPVGMGAPGFPTPVSFDDLVTRSTKNLSLPDSGGCASSTVKDFSYRSVRDVRVAQLRQGLRLNLADPLA